MKPLAIQCRYRFILPLVIFVLAAAAVMAAELDDGRQKLKDIERRINQTARSLEEKKEAEHSLAGDLQTVENEISRLGSGISGQKQRLVTLETDIAGKAAAAETAQRSIASLDTRVRRRLTALYKGGETGPVRILFSPTPPAVMAENVDFLGRVVRRDRELLTTYRRQLTELKAALEQLASLREEQRQTLAALGENQKAARQALQLKSQLLGQVRRDRQALTATLEELRAKAKALTALVKRLESEKAPEYTEKTGVFASRKGRLPWPAEGPVRIGFGTGRHPDLGTLHDSQGIEIAVAGDKPIRSVAAGEVIFANWFKGYGNLLIVDHGGSYYSLYAQASRLTRKVGDAVGEGETLAFSGLEGTGGVYFEIRRGGVPLDPTAWLSPR